MIPLPAQVIQKKLQKLGSIENKKIPILSLYLYNSQNINKKDLEKAITSFLNTDEYDLFTEELQRVKTYIENQQFTAVAFFISNDLFESIVHEFIIPAQCFIGHKPYISLLEKAVIGYSIALVLGEKKIIIAVLYQGRIENYKEIVITKIAQNKIIIRVTEEIKKILQGRKLNEIFIGGENNTTEKIIKKFPLELKKKIKGTFLSQIYVPEHTVIEHILHTAGVLEKEFIQNSME